MERVFFLGGHDLEMLTIKKILEEEDQVFVDNNLSWNNALLSKYVESLTKYSTSEFQIYGIELREDVEVPANYHRIDHHDSFESNLSALSQVCNLLGRKMNKEELLIAANDERYIPGMLSIGATKEEIEIIRRKDRECQGISPEDEKNADEAIRCNTKNYFGLTYVYTKSTKFSLIVDKLFPTSRLFVYTDDEFTYYGERKEESLKIVSEMFPGIHFFKGGGDNGYFGASECSKNDIDKILSTIMKMQTISEHIFMFPFIWESSKSEMLDGAFKSISNCKSSDWERVKLSETDNKKPDIYNEQNFFYPFIHDTIYDTNEGSHIRHFERIEPKKQNVKYVITIKEKTYSLPVKKMHLNFYTTGVGVLTFFVENNVFSDEIDILNINQFGRRIFIPFYNDARDHNETAYSLAITGLNKEYSKTFIPQGMTPNTPAQFILNLIYEVSDYIKNVQPILDDRMFVMSWFKCSSRDFSNDESYYAMIAEDNNFLYRYIYVDTSSQSCQTKQMLENLLSSSIYDRWQRLGTLYGISRYSFVMLTTPNCPDFLLKNFETEYKRIVEIVLVQRASILRLSKVLKNSTNSKYKHFSQDYAEYIDFLSKYRFPEISAQDQATELYDSLCEKLRIKENADHLDKQFNEVQEYLELNNQRYLNIWAAILVPVSLLSAGYTFLFHDDFALKGIGIFENLENSGPIWLIISILASVVFGVYFSNKNK